MKMKIIFLILLGLISLCAGNSSTDFYYVDGRYDEIMIDGNIYNIDGIIQSGADYDSYICREMRYYLNFAEKIDYEVGENGSIKCLSTLHITGDRINLRDYIMEKVREG
jgi:hypothetical protein